MDQRIKTCNCPNRHLLDTGEICELCMGKVDKPAYLAEFPGKAKPDPWDELYFEELESYFDDIEYAA